MNYYEFDCKCYEDCYFLKNKSYVLEMLVRMAKLHELGLKRKPAKIQESENGVSITIFLRRGYISFCSNVNKNRYLIQIMTYEDEYDKANAYIDKFFPHSKRGTKKRKEKKLCPQSKML